VSGDSEPRQRVTVHVSYNQRGDDEGPWQAITFICCFAGSPAADSRSPTRGLGDLSWRRRVAEAWWHSAPVAGTGVINHGQWQSDKRCSEADWEEKLLWRVCDGEEASTTCVNKGHRSAEADPNSSPSLNLPRKAITATRPAASWPSAVLLFSPAEEPSFSGTSMALEHKLWKELCYLEAVGWRSRCLAVAAPLPAIQVLKTKLYGSTVVVFLLVSRACIDKKGRGCIFLSLIVSA